jgi:hypothetical protein
LQARELYPERVHATRIGFAAPFLSAEQAAEIVRFLSAVETGLLKIIVTELIIIICSLFI